MHKPKTNAGILNMFDRALAKHDAHAERTLAGFRMLGLDFPSIWAARKWRNEQKTEIRNIAEAISRSAVNSVRKGTTR